MELQPDVQLPPPALHERIRQRVGRWILKRVRKRVAREWREYDHAPKVSFGPILPWRRSRQGGDQVYRSLVQIHFHPRERERRSAARLPRARRDSAGQ